MIRFYLAPMEGVGDAPFRKAMATIGGFDEASTEFIRVPKDGHIESLSRKYNPNEINPIPLAAQVMGCDPALMGAMARRLQERGAPRVDLNCGCPSNTVVGKGAGSSVLKDPEHLYQIAKEMRNALDVSFSIKIRSGYEDESLFTEILDAVEASGADQVTVHPRTKVDGYGPPARWERIAEAKERLSITVVGSGDVRTPEDAERMVRETSCDGVMIGRGAIANPWIFQQIKGCGDPSWPQLEKFVDTYFLGCSDLRPKTQVGKLKQLLRFLAPDAKEIFRSQETHPQSFLMQAKLCLKRIPLVVKGEVGV